MWRIFFTLNRKEMKSRRSPGQTKKAGDVAGAGDGVGGEAAKDSGAGGDDRVGKEGGGDRGRQPEGTDDSEDRVIHNGSAGAFEAAEDGRYEEDSDEDNDDLAMGH
jgi:hypothetical protein